MLKVARRTNRLVEFKHPGTISRDDKNKLFKRCITKMIPQHRLRDLQHRWLHRWKKPWMDDLSCTEKLFQICGINSLSVFKILILQQIFSFKNAGITEVVDLTGTYESAMACVLSGITRWKGAKEGIGNLCFSCPRKANLVFALESDFEAAWNKTTDWVMLIRNIRIHYPLNKAITLKIRLCGSDTELVIIKKNN